jgi:hypothetical protein
MRYRVFAFASLVAGFIACADSEDTAPGATTDAGGSADTSAKSDSTTGNGDSSAPEDSGGGTDTGTKDSSTDTKAQDVTSDVSTDTGSSADAAADAIVDAPYDVPDSGCPGATVVDPGCVVPGGNFAFCGTATATSTYVGYPASNTIDTDLNTSWYSESGTCSANDGGPVWACTTPLYVDIALNMPRTIGRIKLFGNRDFTTTYDTLTARLELRNGLGNVIHSADLVTSRGNEPNGDLDHAFTPVSCVKSVRIIVKTGESGGPGLAEIQAFAN